MSSLSGYAGTNAETCFTWNSRSAAWTTRKHTEYLAMDNFDIQARQAEMRIRTATAAVRKMATDAKLEAEASMRPGQPIDSAKTKQIIGQLADAIVKLANTIAQ